MHDDLVALQRKVAQSEPLSRVADQLQHELASHAVKAGIATFDPMLVIMVISVILQIIYLCRQRNADAALTVLAVREVPMLDGRRTLRLRRRLNKVWKDYCRAHNLEPTKENPLVAAALSLSANAADADIQALLLAAEEQ
jgi:hypothetical protein